MAGPFSRIVPLCIANANIMVAAYMTESAMHIRLVGEGSVPSSASIRSLRTSQFSRENRLQHKLYLISFVDQFGTKFFSFLEQTSHCLRFWRHKAIHQNMVWLFILSSIWRQGFKNKGRIIQIPDLQVFYCILEVLVFSCFVYAYIQVYIYIQDW